MREAIGSSFLFTVVVVLVGAMIVLFVGNISYNKVYRVKNRIIEIIEKHAGYTAAAQDEINQDLAGIGYRVNYNKATCKARANATIVHGENSSGYRYCIYLYRDIKGFYYGVTTFIHFDIPLIGNYLEFPVYGETKKIYSTIQG